MKRVPLKLIPAAQKRDPYYWSGVSRECLFAFTFLSIIGCIQLLRLNLHSAMKKPFELLAHETHKIRVENRDLHYICLHQNILLIANLECKVYCSEGTKQPLMGP